MQKDTDQLIIEVGTRNGIVKIIAESNIPTNQGVIIINALNQLKTYEEKTITSTTESK